MKMNKILKEWNNYRRSSLKEDELGEAVKKINPSEWNWVDPSNPTVGQDSKYPFFFGQPDGVLSNFSKSLGTEFASNNSKMIQGIIEKYAPGFVDAANSYQERIKTTSVSNREKKIVLKNKKQDIEKYISEELSAQIESLYNNLSDSEKEIPGLYYRKFPTMRGNPPQRDGIETVAQEAEEIEFESIDVDAVYEYMKASSYKEKLTLQIESIDALDKKLRRQNKNLGVHARRLEQAKSGYAWNIYATLSIYFEMSDEQIKPIIEEIALERARYFKKLVNKSENKVHQMYYIRYYFQDFVDNLKDSGGQSKTQAYADFEFKGPDANYMGKPNNENLVILAGMVGDFYLGNPAEYPYGAFDIVVDAMKKQFKPVSEKNQMKVTFEDVPVKDGPLSDIAKSVEKDFYVDKRTNTLKPKDKLKNRNKGSNEKS